MDRPPVVTQSHVVIMLLSLHGLAEISHTTCILVYDNTEILTLPTAFKLH